MECTYCGGTSGRRTREHLIPQWIQRELDVTNQVFNFSTMKSDGTLGDERSMPAKSSAWSVCNECNNGWLSIIDNSGATFLPEMFKRGDHALDKMKKFTSAHADIIRTLCYKIFLGHMAVGPAKNELGDAYAKFFASKAPPPGLSLFMGTICNTIPLDFTHSAAWRWRGREGDELIPVGRQRPAVKFYLQLGMLCLVIVDTGTDDVGLTYPKWMMNCLYKGGHVFPVHHAVLEPFMLSPFDTLSHRMLNSFVAIGS